MDVPDQGFGRQPILAVVGERQLNLCGVKFEWERNRKGSRVAPETISHKNCNLYDIILGVSGERKARE